MVEVNGHIFRCLVSVLNLEPVGQQKMYINSFGQVKGKLFQVSEYDLCLKGAKSDTFYLKGYRGSTGYLCTVK